MKRFLTTFLATAVLASSLLFVGCSSTDENSSNESSSTESSSEDEAKVSYQYYTAEETKSKIENKEDMYILDIQVEDEFEKHHLEGAIPTYAYPVESDEDRAKLDSVLDDLKAGSEPILVVCPGGGGGATRTVDYLTEKGIDADRMFILEKGQGGWSYDELLAK